MSKRPFFKRDNKSKHHSREDGASRGRHPPHLRGREIGLFYARRHQIREAANLKKPMGTILLSESKKLQIQEILDDTANTFNMNVDNIQFHAQFKKVVTGRMVDKLIQDVGFEQDPELDDKLFKDFTTRKGSDTYRKMLEVRQRLPSYKQKEAILQFINDNQVVVISGETGCGKTTQVAQFILDYYLENKKGSVCNVVCTQPRRISAITVAERVAAERAEMLRHSVGYQIRVEHRLPRNKGSILFCTTGMVLRRLESDPCLQNISHVILDEIHERDILSDVLIGFLKQVISKRTDLKLILMSATLNAEKFSRYFNNCPHISIPGFTYPVQEYYLEDVLQQTGFMFDPHVRPRQVKEDPLFEQILQTHIRELEATKTYSRQVCFQLRNPLIEEMNLDLVLALLVHICQNEDEGAILVFLTGYQEISKLISLMTDSGRFPNNQYLILPLHSIMPTINQRQVFDKPYRGIRKIIVSTNIAETSITIDDVVFVVDCGKIKMSNYIAETNSATLKPEWVSLANASQRKGRAGRVQPGICYHLFTKARQMVLPQYQMPEILRSRLENTILKIKILQLGDTVTFLKQLMDCPSLEIISTSIELLKRLEALDENEQLTPLGYHLAKLPVQPQIGKMILLGAIFNCTNPVLSVAASLDFKEAFQKPIGKESLSDRKKSQLAGDCKSDHLVLYEALRQFERRDGHSASQFCWEYFLSRQTLSQLINIKKQLMEHLYEMDFVDSKEPESVSCNMNSHNMSLVKAIIAAGLYPNVANIRIRKRGNTAYVLETGKKASIHPKSILYKEVGFESPLIVYYLKIHSTADFIHDGTMVHPLPIVFFGDNYKYNADGKNHCITIGSERLRFKCSRTTNDIIKKLRQQLNLILEQKVSNPGFVNWQANDNETAVLRAVMELITSEDIGDMEFDAYDDYD